MKIAKLDTIRQIRSSVKMIINTVDLLLSKDLRSKECPYKSKGYYGQRAVKKDLEIARFYLQSIIGKKNCDSDLSKMIPPKTRKALNMGWYD